jgi:phage terminase Nu1 subunit (DNA packaging protein)
MAKPNSDTAEQGTTTAPVLAELFGCTDRHIRQLADRGVLTRTSRGNYPLGASIKKYIAYIKAQAGGEDVAAELQKAKLRKENAIAAREELALAKEQNEVALVEVMERGIAMLMAEVRANMTAVATRAATAVRGVSSVAKIKELIAGEIKQALECTADFKIVFEESAADDIDANDVS